MVKMMNVLRAKFTCPSGRAPNSSRVFNFLNSSGTLFHKRLPLKNNARVPCW